MTYGIQLENAGGKRVIGSDTTVPRFVGKYSRTTWSSTSSSGHRLTYTVACPSLPLCFLHVGAQAARVSTISGTSGSWTVEVLVAYQTGMAPNDITMYVFSAGYTSQSSGHGIRVKKSDGEVAFDTGYDQLQIKKSFFGHGRGSSTTVNWAAEGVSKPAFMGNLFADYSQVWFGITKYWYFLSAWLPTMWNLYHLPMADFFKADATGFGVLLFYVNDLPTIPAYSDYTISLPPGAALYEALLSTTIQNEWIDRAEYTYGSNGTYLFNDPCVGSSCFVTSCLPANWSLATVTGVPLLILPPSNSYDIFVIDGADYD